MLKGHFHSFCFLTSSSTLKAFIGANTQCQGEYYGITLVLLEGLRFWTESRGLGLVRERERERECPCVYSFPTAKTIIGLFKTSSSPHVDYSPVLNSENRIFQTEVKVRTRWCHGPMGGRQGAQGDPQKIGRKIKINVVNKLNQYFLFKIFNNHVSQTIRHVNCRNCQIFKFPVLPKCTSDTNTRDSICFVVSTVF